MSFDRGRRKPNVDQSDRSSSSYFNRCPYFWKTGKKEEGRREEEDTNVNVAVTEEGLSS